VQERPIQAVAFGEMTIRRRFAVAFVAQHGVAQAGQVAADLVLSTVLGVNFEQRVSADAAR
jgi:hypothetical protein